MFTRTEALGLVMAVLEGDHGAADPTDPGRARARQDHPGPARAGRRPGRRRTPGRRARAPTTGRAPRPRDRRPSWSQACAAARRLRLGYRLGPGRDRAMEVDPWAVVVRHGRWYLLCWSHTSDARRVLRVDRVVTVDALPDTFTPPADLDPVRAVEGTSRGLEDQVEVVIDAPVADVGRVPPTQPGPPRGARRRALPPGRATDEPDWYARQLTAIEAPFCIVEPPELREAAALLGRRLMQAVTTGDH